MNTKCCFTITILYRLPLLLITLFFIIACGNSELVIEEGISDRSDGEIQINERVVENTGKKAKFGYVDWWPVSTGNDGSREYTASTSSVKEIPFPFKIIKTPEPTIK